MQVKQSARKQTWGLTAQSRYAITPAKGFYEGTVWKELPSAQRLSEVYLFAHHPIEDDRANHWDAQQWRFTVVRESELPSTKSIKHAQLSSWPVVGIADLADRVSAVCDGLAPNGRAEKAAVKKAGPTDDSVDDLLS